MLQQTFPKVALSMLLTTNKFTDSTLTGWTTSITAGDVLGFYVTSNTAATQLILQLTTV